MKRLPKKEYEQRKYIKSQEKHMSDKTRKIRSSIRIMFEKWQKEDENWMTR